MRNQSGQDPLNFPIKVNNRLASLLGVVSRVRRAARSPTPTRSSAISRRELKVETDRLQKILMTDLPAFNAEAKRLGLEPIVINKQTVVF